MSFLAIIIALLLVQAWGSGNRVQHDAWFSNWQSRVAAMGLLPKVSLGLVILVPVALAQVLLVSLEPLLFGLLWIALAVLLLLYSFGRRDFHELMERYQGQSGNADFEGAFLTTLAELGWASSDDDPGSPAEVHALVQRGFSYEGYQRWFAVLFYFALLGPAGALAYRLLQLCREDFETQLTRRCLFIADWVPARLLAASFALTGDFVGSRDKLLDALMDSSVDAGQMLYTVAMAALAPVPSGAGVAEGFGDQAARQNRELAGLLRRSAACWIAVLSLLVLFV